MSVFDFSIRTRIIYGTDAVNGLGTLVHELGLRNAFLVTDRGVADAGHVERAERSLVDAGIEVRRYENVRENPTGADVDACFGAFSEGNADVLIGLGGGSSIDVAKGCNFLHAGGGRMEDYRGHGKVTGTMLPLIAIPTTAGTGSEVQSFALIGQEESHQKMACGDPQAAPVMALLDPTLTVTQPEFVTACTGLDALGHAVETAVTTKRNPISQLFSTEALRLVWENFSRVMENPDDLDARGGMLMGAACAGLAIENSMLGAAHAMANPLTAHFGITHGQAVGMMLPVVVRFNAADPETAACYASLARRTGLCPEEATDEAGVDDLISGLNFLLHDAGLETTLSAFNVHRSEIEMLAEEAAGQWTAGFNPRQLTVSDFMTLLEEGRPHPA